MFNKNKGFTLIELLAVIIILAVIALILTPTIMDIIDTSREKAAEESVDSYVSAANNASAISLVNSDKGISITTDKYIFETNKDDVILARIDTSGVTPMYTYLEYSTTSKEVTIGHFCIKGYSIDYINGKTSKSSNDYCNTNADDSGNSSNNFEYSLPISSILQLNIKNANNISWTSSDSSIATVDSDGIVIGVSKGTVTITGTVGSNSSNFTVNVISKKYYSDGEAIYFNVDTGSSCTQSEAVSTTNTKKGCMRFYAFNDSTTSKTVNMILDHNSTSNKTPWALSGSNLSGPCKTSGCAYYQLLEDTNNWVGVEKQTNYTYTSSSKNYVITYGDDNANARFITANEVAKMTGNKIFNSTVSAASSWFYFDSNSQTKVSNSLGTSRFGWLYSYTYQCGGYGCNAEDNTSYPPSYAYGYFTADALNTNSGDVWNVDRLGYLVTNPSSHTGLGIRPVITVKKVNL